MCGNLGTGWSLGAHCAQGAGGYAYRSFLTTHSVRYTHSLPAYNNQQQEMSKNAINIGWEMCGNVGMGRDVLPHPHSH